ncbi:MAG: dTDP-4-dehydrorhamnose 3,5-epimerase family protein [bacterium]
MKYVETPLVGAYKIELTPIKDNRGFFSRAFCLRELEDHGLPFKAVQGNICHSDRKHTLHGLHYQTGTASEIKLFRVIRGSVLDVILDLREGSPTFGHHFKSFISAEAGNMLYIPKGMAHGYLTLEDHCEVFYTVSEFYAPEHNAGIRWNDPYFNIEWPVTNPVLSQADENQPDFDSNTFKKIMNEH